MACVRRLEELCGNERNLIQDGTENSSFCSAKDTVLRVLTGFKISEKMCRIIWDGKWEQEKVDLPATQDMGDIFKGGSTKYHEQVGHRLLFFSSWGWNMSGE